MRSKRGAVLLEVIVAMAILATAGLAVVGLTVAASDAVERATRSEAELREASAFLEAVALWPREDLDRRLGTRPQGAWRLTIQRPDPTLYTIVLADSASSSVLLETSLYRPGPVHAAP